jgi:hypothetical protein
VFALAVSPADGVAIANHAEPIAEALAELAETNRYVARLLDGAGTVGGWLGLALAVAPLVAEIAANHGALGAASPLFATKLATSPAAATGSAAGPVPAGDVAQPTRFADLLHGPARVGAPGGAPA